MRLREPAFEEHRLLTDEALTVNLHVWSPGTPEPQRHLLFRDFLRAHPDDAAAYGAFKIELARGTFSSGMDYNNGKAAVVYDLYEKAFAADSAHDHTPRPRD